MKLDLFLLLLLIHILINVDVYYFFFFLESQALCITCNISFDLSANFVESPSSPHLLNEETKAQNVN